MLFRKKQAVKFVLLHGGNASYRAVFVNGVRPQHRRYWSVGVVNITAYFANLTQLFRHGIKT